MKMFFIEFFLFVKVSDEVVNNIVEIRRYFIKIKFKSYFELEFYKIMI